MNPAWRIHGTAQFGVLQRRAARSRPEHEEPQVEASEQNHECHRGDEPEADGECGLLMPLVRLDAGVYRHSCNEETAEDVRDDVLLEENGREHHAHREWPEDPA